MFKLFKMLKPDIWAIAAVMVLLFLSALAQLYLPTLMSDIVDTGVVRGNTAYIMRTGAWMLAVALIGTVCAVAAGYFSSKTAVGFGRNLRNRIFGHVERFSLQEFDEIGTASMITRSTNDINHVQQVLNMMLRMFIRAPLVCVGGIVMAVSKDAELSLIFIVILPVLAGVIFLIARRGMPLFRIIQTKIDRLNLVLRERLTGIRVIRAFNRMEFEQHRFAKANRDLTDTALRAGQTMSAMMPAMGLVMNFSTIAIMWYGGIRVGQGAIQVGDLMAFLQYAMQIMFSLMMVSMMFIMIPRASASAARINEVLATNPSITDANENSESNASGTRGELVFDHVTFHYPGAEQPAIQDVTFSAKPGEVTAIIGGTGAGKSTLLNLLLRFYEPGQGSILIDGEAINGLTQEELRAKIGYVPQKALLFTGTIADNIRFGQNSASDEEVRKAAEIAQADEFIGKMKDGYESVITQGGTNLSGGQKQRLSIARALVRKPEIYVFDDSFSALDFKTDANLRGALEAETGDACTLIVAQRVSTIMDADRIIVMEEGRVAGIGTHRQLMENCRVYREIVASQLSEEEIA